MENDKEPSIYMRFHVTLQKAISFCKELYGDSVLPGTKIPYFNLALTTAGLTEDIISQDYLDYHLTWLTGVLCDAQFFNEQVYSSAIQNILSELHDVESNRVQRYIDLLTYKSKLPRGQQLKDMLERVQDMDVIPCYIMIFRLYHRCESMRQAKEKVEKEEYEGFQAFAYLFWYRAISRWIQIGKNIKPYMKEFFKKI